MPQTWVPRRGVPPKTGNGPLECHKPSPTLWQAPSVKSPFLIIPTPQKDFTFFENDWRPRGSPIQCVEIRMNQFLNGVWRCKIHYQPSDFLFPLSRSPCLSTANAPFRIGLPINWKISFSAMGARIFLSYKTLTKRSHSYFVAFIFGWRQNFWHLVSGFEHFLGVSQPYLNFLRGHFHGLQAASNWSFR